MQGVEAHFVGLDIGRATDHSALCVVARRIEKTDPSTIDFKDIFQRYYVVYLRRFPLDTEYEIVENETERVWKLPELVPTHNWCVVDQTGVGAPIVEALRKRHIPVNGIVITAGNTVSNPAPNEWHVPKPALVTNLAKLVQGGRLKVLEGVENWQELKEELGTFGYKVNRETANVTYESLVERVHDDLVIAVALSVWFAERNIPSPTWPRRRAHIAEKYNPLAKASLESVRR